MTGNILYGLRAGYGRQIDLDWPLKMLVPFGESLLDLEARVRYPLRTGGTKVVMISAPVARAREQVAAMDRHVRALEARLGRPLVGRVHWVRGPLFGMQGKAINAGYVFDHTSGLMLFAHRAFFVGAGSGKAGAASLTA